MNSPAPGPPEPPPAAALIRIAREAAGLSPESAAARMAIKFGGTRWRQIEAGFRGDYSKPVVAKAATLAHMAQAVGVTSTRLAEAGREDAATILREIETQQAADSPEAAITDTPPTPGPEGDAEEWRRAFEAKSPDEQMQILRELLDATRQTLKPDREAEGDQRRTG